MKIVKLELVSRPDEIHLGKIYSRESYNKARQDFINTNGFLYLIEIDTGMKYDGTIRPESIIGKVVKWEDCYIEVDIKDECYDKYDWENCKAGMYYKTLLIKDDEKPEITKSDIDKVVGFHILIPSELEAINRENDKYK